MDADLAALYADPAVSDWLKCAVSALMQRDPVDAANDADALARIMDQRASAMVSAGRGNGGRLDAT